MVNLAKPCTLRLVVYGAYFRRITADASCSIVQMLSVPRGSLLFGSDRPSSRLTMIATQHIRSIIMIMIMIIIIIVANIGK